MNLNSKVYLLFPFDMGIELNFTEKDASKFFKEISAKKIESLSFETGKLQPAVFSTQVYRFGVGLIQIAFSIDAEPNYLTHLACNVEKINIGKTNIVSYCRSHIDKLIKKADQYASYRYEHRFSETEIFPVFVLTEPPSEDAASFIKKNQKALFGLLAGEQDYNFLSDFVLEKQTLENFGYFENEIIMIKRFGAIVSSRESSDITEMIKLAFAQYWTMRSYNFILDHELAASKLLLEKLPPYYKILKMWQAYQNLSSEALGFDRDKITIVDSLYNVLMNIPKVESDWHLKTVYKNVTKVFDIEELHKTVETKIERISESYNLARDLLSTNFFILLDLIFFLWLAWSVLDTYLFWQIAFK